MADGWARATGGVGVVTTTSGPGTSQLATSMIVASRARTPLIAFCGETPLGDEGAVQYLDQRRFAAAIECGFVHVTTADAALEPLSGPSTSRGRVAAGDAERARSMSSSRNPARRRRYVPSTSSSTSRGCCPTRPASGWPPTSSRAARRGDHRRARRAARRRRRGGSPPAGTDRGPAGHHAAGQELAARRVPVTTSGSPGCSAARWRWNCCRRPTA